MNTHARIVRLARALRMEPREDVDLVRGPGGTWILVGCIASDRAMPGTMGARDVREAIEAAEAWFAPELDRASCTARPA